MSRLEVAILGCGGFAREVLWALRQGHVVPTGDRIKVAGFIDRAANPSGLAGLPVWSLDTAPKGLQVVCGIGGMPEIKERACTEAEDAGFAAAPPIVFDNVEIGPGVQLGDGTIVCAGNILTVDITIGRHVAINLDCTVGHDSVIGDFATLSPGTHLSGRVAFGRGVYAGTGCSIIEGLTIGDYAVIAAGAAVTKDVPQLAMVAGVPAIVKKLPRTLVVPVRSAVAAAGAAPSESRR